MTSIAIHEATEADMPEVAGVFRLSRRHALPYLPELHSPEEDRNYFARVIFPRDEVWIARDTASGNLIAFIAFSKELVDHLYVLPGFQRQGVGEKLLNIAKERLASMQLWVFQRNVDAQRFYAKRGFEVIRRTEGSGNEEREPDALMEWRASCEPRRAKSDESGVTLLELLVVVALASILLAVVFPSVGTGLSGLELSGAARRVAAAARFARDEAVRRRSTLQLEVDSASGTIAVADLERGPSNARRFELPTSVRIEQVLPEEPGSIGESRRFLFTPDGAAPEFQIVLANQRRQVTVINDALTGAATVTE
jgi:prepilin-type N-terminal cleavage/methylation domain-containing protein